MDERIKFIDLFAGIGGIRLPFDELGYQCVFSSEWDRAACDTYEANFGERTAKTARLSRQFQDSSPSRRDTQTDRQLSGSAHDKGHSTKD